MKNRNYFYLTILLGLIGFFPGIQSVSIDQNIDQVSQLYNRMLSTYNQSDYDILLAQPGLTQKENIMAIEGVEDIFSFFKDESLLQFNNQSFPSITIFSNENNRDITPFNERRVLKQLDSRPTNFIEVDQIVANQLELSLGDSVQVSFSFGASFPFIVSTIYMEDYSYSLDNQNNGVSYVEYTDSLEDYLQTLYGEGLHYFGAYLKVDDVSSTKTRLENEYKPYGQMFPRSNFPNQSAYDAYVETFLSKTYPFASTLKEDALNNLVGRLNFDLDNFTDQQIRLQSSAFLLTSSIISIIFFVAITLLNVFFKQQSQPILALLKIAIMYAFLFLFTSLFAILINQRSLALFVNMLPFVWSIFVPALILFGLFTFSFAQALASKKTKQARTINTKSKNNNQTPNPLEGTHTPHEE